MSVKTNQFINVPRPTAELAAKPLTDTSRGIQRGSLLLALTITGIVSTLLGSLLGFVMFLWAGKTQMQATAQQAVATAGKLIVDQEVSKVEAKWAERLAVAELGLREKDARLRDEQLRTERTEQQRNIFEASLADTRRDQQSMSNDLFRMVKPALERSLMVNLYRIGPGILLPSSGLPFPIHKPEDLTKAPTPWLTKEGNIQ